MWMVPLPNKCNPSRGLFQPGNGLFFVNDPNGYPRAKETNFRHRISFHGSKHAALIPSGASLENCLDPMLDHFQLFHEFRKLRSLHKIGIGARLKGSFGVGGVSGRA